MAEDDDLDQDSEAYRKWRSGNDNDKYASSKTPSETGARSGSYTATVPEGPKSENDEYTLPDEDDNSERLPLYAWVFLIVPTLIFGIVMLGAITSESGDSGGSNPSDWPSVEGTITDKFVLDKFISEEYCEDNNDDGYFDDEECWKEFVYIAEVSYMYTVEDTSDVNGCEGCFYGETVELWESHWVDELKREGEDKLFQEFINATDERLAVNSTVKIFYNPENASDAYSEFGEVYEDAESGFFLIGIGAALCVPIVFGAIFIGSAQRARGNGGDYRPSRWDSFTGSDNSRNGRRNNRAVRRSGGSSRSGGGGRSGSGSRGGGGRSSSGGRSRSGGGGRRR